jgi:hypothetical protein
MIGIKELSNMSEERVSDKTSTSYMTGEYNAVIKHMAGIEDKNILMS